MPPLLMPPLLTPPFLMPPLPSPPPSSRPPFCTCHVHYASRAAPPLVRRSHREGLGVGARR
eukprot:6903818-Prorocentrum_lima.AAC.1